MQKHQVWLISLLAVAFCAVSSAHAITTENPDVQSPEELSRAHQIIDEDFKDAVDPSVHPELVRPDLADVYAYLDPKREVPTDLLKKAVAYWDTNKNKFPNQDYITIVDFKPRSDKYRLFIINMKDGSVAKFHTTHGVNSDPNKDGIATKFGNVVNSGKSSLGFMRTAEVYRGKYKRALRLDGLSSTNSNVRDRAIVFHGWDDVHEANVIQGMSHGCITLDWAIKDAQVDKIKEGSLMYVGLSKTP